jgi:hypothetical protein
VMSPHRKSIRVHSPEAKTFGAREEGVARFRKSITTWAHVLIRTGTRLYRRIEMLLSLMRDGIVEPENLE